MILCFVSGVSYPLILHKIYTTKNCISTHRNTLNRITTRLIFYLTNTYTVYVLKNTFKSKIIKFSTVTENKSISRINVILLIFMLICLFKNLFQ